MAIITSNYDNDRLIEALKKRMPELEFGPSSRVEDIDVPLRHSNSSEWGVFEIKLEVPMRWADIADILHESEV